MGGLGDVQSGTGRSVTLGALLLALCLALALDAPQRLSVGSLRLSDSEEPPLVLATSGEVPPRSPVYDVALDVIEARLRSDPSVEAVSREVEPGGVDLEVRLRDAGAGEQLAAIHRLQAAIDPGPLEVRAEGELVELDQARQRFGAELWRVAIALPVVAALAWLLLGAAAALAAVAAAALAILGTAAALRLLDFVADPSLLALLAGAPLGAALALELSAARACHGTSRGRHPWRPVVLAASAGALIAPLALLLTPLEQAGWLALGCCIAALFAGVGTMLFVPVASGQRGPWVPRLRLTALRRVVRGRWLALAAWSLAVAGVVALGFAATELRSQGVGAPADGSLPDDLPLAGAALVVLAALLAVAGARSLWAAPLGLAPALPLAAALGAATLLLQGDDAPLGLDAVPALDTAALAAGIAVLGALALARTAWALEYARRGGPADEAAQRGVILRGALLGSLALALAGAALLPADEPAAQQLGLIVGVGALADLLVVRTWMPWVAARIARAGAA